MYERNHGKFEYTFKSNITVVKGLKREFLFFGAKKKYANIEVKKIILILTYI